MAYNGSLGAITAASGGSALPVTLLSLILGNVYLPISSIWNVAHDEEINTIGKGAGVGVAKGSMSGFFVGMVQGIAHFAPLVDGHSHEHVLNIAHTVQDHANPAVHPDNLTQEGMKDHVDKLKIIFQKEVPQDITSSNFDITNNLDQGTTNYC